MRSMIWKSTFREIKESLGRFLAILAIVALGVGFFAGLKVTQPAMLKTAQRYFDKTALYDYRLISTVGFSEDEVETIKKQKDVKAAEGAVTFDIICESGGKERVLKMHSITEDVNRLVLVDGELPENAGECVVDSNLYGASMIGKTIKLSDGNDEDDLEHFSNREYKITGIVQSPLYSQFERGSTSLGNGRVSGFVYLLPEGFADDYYTEVYVKFACDFPLYSEEYDAYIEQKQDAWEALTEDLAAERYQTVRSEAETKLADGKKQLAEKKEETKSQLDDAKKQLEDAKSQIEDGEKQLADAKKKLEYAPDELEKKEAELTEAEKAIQEKETQLDQAEVALGIGYAQGVGQIQKALNGISEGLFSENGDQGNGAAGSFSSGDALADAGSQIADAKAQIADGRAQIAEAQKQIESGKSAIAKAKKQLEESKTQIAEKEAELSDAKTQYEDGKKEYEDGLSTYNEEIEKAEKKISDGEKTLKELKDPDTYVLGRDTNVGYVCFESDSGIVDGVADVFPIFFFLVAALVCVTTMNRMVEEQRTQIGVLKALGYSEHTIMAKYMFYSGSAALTGCVAGFALGTFLFPKVIWYAYGMLYKMDSLVYVFDWKLAVISVIVSLLCSIGTTFVSVRRELTEVAAELMRPKTPKAGKRVFLEYIPFVWKRLKFLQKVSMRNIFRYKKRFFMMVAGISGCSALLVTGFGVRDSVTGIVTQQYTQIQTYDIGVTYSSSVTPEQKSELESKEQDGVEKSVFVAEKSMDLVGSEKTKSVSLIIADPDSDMTPFVNLHTEKGVPITFPKKGEAVISAKVADELGIKTGDTVTLQDSDMKTISVTVRGLCENFVYNYVYLSADTYEEQMKTEPEYKNAFVCVSEGTDAHLLGTSLMAMSDVAAVNISQDDMERFSSMMGSMDLIVVVIILCAAGLAFIVLYNLTNINITERVCEIATIEVLGFYENETAAYVFRENTILTFLGALAGLVLGVFLHRFVMSQIVVDMVAFDVHVKPVSFVYSVVLTLVFTWFVDRLMRKKIDAISMTESLKSVD